MNTQKTILYLGCSILIGLALYRVYNSSVIEGMTDKQMEDAITKLEKANKKMESKNKPIEKALEDIESIKATTEYQDLVDNIKTGYEGNIKYFLVTALIHASQNGLGDKGFQAYLDLALKQKNYLELIQSYA